MQDRTQKVFTDTTISPNIQQTKEIKMSLNLQNQAKKSYGEKSSLSKLCNFSKESASLIEDTASIDTNTSPPRSTYHFVPVST